MQSKNMVNRGSTDGNDQGHGQGKVIPPFAPYKAHFIDLPPNVKELWKLVDRFHCQFISGRKLSMSKIEDAHGVSIEYGEGLCSTGLSRDPSSLPKPLQVIKNYDGIREEILRAEMPHEGPEQCDELDGGLADLLSLSSGSMKRTGSSSTMDLLDCFPRPPTNVRSEDENLSIEHQPQSQQRRGLTMSGRPPFTAATGTGNANVRNPRETDLLSSQVKPPDIQDLTAAKASITETTVGEKRIATPELIPAGAMETPSSLDFFTPSTRRLIQMKKEMKSAEEPRKMKLDEVYHPEIMVKKNEEEKKGEKRMLQNTASPQAESLSDPFKPSSPQSSRASFESPIDAAIQLPSDAGRFKIKSTIGGRTYVIDSRTLPPRPSGESYISRPLPPTPAAARHVAQSSVKTSENKAQHGEVTPTRASRRSYLQQLDSEIEARTLANRPDLRGRTPSTWPLKGKSSRMPISTVSRRAIGNPESVTSSDRAASLPIAKTDFAYLICRDNKPEPSRIEELPAAKIVSSPVAEDETDHLDMISRHVDLTGPSNRDMFNFDWNASWDGYAQAKVKRSESFLRKQDFKRDLQHRRNLIESGVTTKIEEMEQEEQAQAQSSKKEWNSKIPLRVFDRKKPVHKAKSFAKEKRASDKEVVPQTKDWNMSESKERGQTAETPKREKKDRFRFMRKSNEKSHDTASPDPAADTSSLPRRPSYSEALNSKKSACSSKSKSLFQSFKSNEDLGAKERSSESVRPFMPSDRP